MPASTTTAQPTQPTQAKPKPHAKETVVSLAIAFVLAFVFRGFVLEGFMIPTGSMAPTLMGAHERVTGPTSGYTWQVGPWDFLDSGGSVPAPTQTDLRLTDPMTGAPLAVPSTPRLSGDRIFVLKYLPGLYDPARWDSVVFRYPGDPRNNYIKRLVALPGEHVALVDGDVFTTKQATSGWTDASWAIARKPERVQRELWQDVFDTRFAPEDPVRDGRRWFARPFTAETPGLSLDAERTYRVETAEPTTLAWDEGARPITDYYAYNQTPPTRGAAIFPVSDIASLMAIEPDSDGMSAVVRLTARNHVFRAQISPDSLRIQMRPLGETDWQDLASEPLSSPVLRAGRTTAIEFWHADQAIWLFANGDQIARVEYEMSPAERLRAATGIDLADDAQHESVEQNTGRGVNRIANPASYSLAQLAWSFMGSTATIHRARVQRDVHYQPGHFGATDADTGKPHPRAGKPSLATHPTTTLKLTGEQYFMCGDNSPASADGRLWAAPHPWIADQVDPTPGVVNKELLVGKAFVVYFPAPHPTRFIPIPDAGRVRFIW